MKCFVEKERREVRISVNRIVQPELDRQRNARQGSNAVA